MLRLVAPAALCLFASVALAQPIPAPDWSQRLQVRPPSRPGHTVSQLGHSLVHHLTPHRPFHPAHPDRRPVTRSTSHPAPPPHRRATPPPPPVVRAPPVVVPPTPLPPPPAPPKGTVTGLPLPRFASLRSDDINLRSGPGARYPIDWVYKRRELPVMIEREFDVWRLIEVPDGTRGWVHQATLTGRRTFVVTGADATLRESASQAAAAVAVLRVGVIGRIRSCDSGDWCAVQAADQRGWLPRSAFWGTSPGEAVAPP